MTIYDYQQPHVRLRTIGYSSREHNKAVVSLRELMPVSRVVHLEKKTNSYGDVYCNVVLYFDEIGVGIDIGHASNSLAITELERRIEAQGIDTLPRFMAWLEQKADTGQFVSNAEIKLASFVDADAAALFTKVRQAFLDRRHAEEQAEQQKQLKEERLQKERIQQVADEQVQRAVQTIKTGGTLENERVEYINCAGDCSESALVNYLAARYDKKFPLKVQGWVNQKLVAVNLQAGQVTGYRYRKTCSNTFSGYMQDLCDKIAA